MKLQTITLPEGWPEGKLYPALRKLLPQIQDSCLREAFRRRDVKMNGVRVSRDTATTAGAEIKIYLSDECSFRSPEILYEDEDLLIVNKPAGVSCEADGRGGLTIGDWLYQAAEGKLAVPPAPCHRLDNPTDGLLILAKNAETLAEMERAFQERRVQKTYVCLVKGTPEPRHAELRAYGMKDAEAARVRVLNHPAHGALTMVTEYSVLEAGEVCRLEVSPHTGRTHQIRAQMAHIGHPILGDEKYGDRAFNRAHRTGRLMLTAIRLDFSLEGKLSYLNERHISIPPKF